MSQHRRFSLMMLIASVSFLLWKGMTHSNINNSRASKERLSLPKFEKDADQLQNQESLYHETQASSSQAAEKAEAEAELMSQIAQLHSEIARAMTQENSQTIASQVALKALLDIELLQLQGNNYEFLESQQVYLSLLEAYQNEFPGLEELYDFWLLQFYAAIHFEEALPLNLRVKKIYEKFPLFDERDRSCLEFLLATRWQSVDADILEKKCYHSQYPDINQIENLAKTLRLYHRS